MFEDNLCDYKKSYIMGENVEEKEGLVMRRRKIMKSLNENNRPQVKEF